MRTLRFKIDRENYKAIMFFNGLLEQVDFDKCWDGSESTMSDKVEAIQSVYLKYTTKPDFQIWHSGQESFADNIQITKVPTLINELSEVLNLKFDIEIEDPFQEKYIIIYNINSDDDEYHMTLRDHFEENDLCKCYGGRYGQINDCTVSACYNITNSDVLFIRDEIYPELSKTVEFGVKTFGFDYEFEWWNHLSLEQEKQIAEEYNILINNSEDFEGKVIPLLIKKAHAIAEEKGSHTRCVAWTYHDGSNFKSVVLSCEIDEYCDVAEVDNLESALILCEYEDGGYFNGVERIVHGDNYKFRITRWSNDPWICHISNN